MKSEWGRLVGSDGEKQGIYKSHCTNIWKFQGINKDILNYCYTYFTNLKQDPHDSDSDQLLVISTNM